MNNDAKWYTKLFVLIISFIVASFLFLNVSTFGDDKEKKFSFGNSTQGVYVIDDLKIDYRYDKTKYEVVPFVSEPYAVIKGDQSLINILKWSKDPEFYIELSGKPPGTYLEQISYTGINKNLEVEFYPHNIEVRLMEQQTITMTPTVELKGKEKVHKDYVVSVPELLEDEVKIRDIQDKLNQVGLVKGEIDVSELTETKEFDVKLTVYDKEGDMMPDINLLNESVRVRVPVEKKVNVIQQEIIEQIVIIEEEKPSKSTEKSKNDIREESIPPKKEGTLSFINIPKNMELINTTSSNIKWSGDIKIDLAGFEEGKYEMTVNDKGEKKMIKFTLKGTPEIEQPTQEEKTQEAEEDSAQTNEESEMDLNEEEQLEDKGETENTNDEENTESKVDE